MLKTLLYPIASALLVFYSYTAMAQQSPLPRLEIRVGATYLVGPENVLHVDTLIMHDRSIIQFAPAKQGRIIANVAYIGNHCTITAKGEDGKKGINGKNGSARRASGKNGESGTPGADGVAGGSLDIKMHFATLGMLIIDTRGGSGGDGGHGGRAFSGRLVTYAPRTAVGSFGNMTTEMVPSGVTETAGSHGLGAPGGRGGAGGNVFLTYSTDGASAPLNHSDNVNKIAVLHAAGLHGIHGRDGSGRTPSASTSKIEEKNLPSLAGELKVVKVDL